MTLPNFLLIGVAKAGTTALYQALKEHPQIYMSPIKEPRFFTFVDSPLTLGGPGAAAYRAWAITDLAAYQRLFADVTNETVIGEASPVYLSCWHPERTAANIKRLIPDVRLVAILRQPAERAYSSFAHQVQMGNEQERNFRKMLAVAARPERHNWLSYRCQQDGFYYANLQPYFARFHREQIRIYLYEEWNTNPQQVLQDIFGFLGVAATFTPLMTQRHNETTWVRNQKVAASLQRPSGWKRRLGHLLAPALRRQIMAGIKQWNRVKPPSLDPQLRSELTQMYRADILQLQDLIGRDLSHWLT